MIMIRDDSGDEIAYLTASDCDINCVIYGTTYSVTLSSTTTSPSSQAATTTSISSPSANLANLINSDQSSTVLIPPSSSSSSFSSSYSTSTPTSSSFSGQNQNQDLTTSTSIRTPLFSAPTTQDLQSTSSIDASTGATQGGAQVTHQTHNIPAIIGVILGGMILMVLLCVIYIKRRRRSQTKLEDLVESFPGSSEKPVTAVSSSTQQNMANNANRVSLLSLNTSAYHGMENAPASDLAAAGSPEPAYPSSLIEPLIPPEDLKRLASISTPISLWESKEKAKSKVKNKVKGKAKAKADSAPFEQIEATRDSRSRGSHKGRTRNKSRSKGHGSRSQPEQEIPPIEPQFTWRTSAFDEPPPPWSDEDSWRAPRYSTIHGSKESILP